MLLSCASLLLNSFVRLKSVAPGFDPERVLTLQISLPELKYSQGYQQAGFFERIVGQIRMLPRVQHAAAAPTLPLSGGLNSYGFSVEGRPAQAGDNLSAEHDAVTSDYFAAMGIRLIQGRFFNEHDTSTSLPVVIINQAAARRFFPGENPLGKRVTIAGPEAGEIVGVVADVRQYALSSQSPPHMYSPQTQKVSSSMTLFVRTSSDPMNLVSAVRQAISDVDNDLPISGVRTLSEVVNASLAQRRFTLVVLGAFSVAALALAAIGIYGVLAFSVAQRSREIGLRLALGAQKGDVVALVLAQGMTLTGIGIGLGLLCALAASRSLSSMLFEVKPSDPVTLTAIFAVMGIVALLACWLPARRAARLDPIQTLRYE